MGGGSLKNMKDMAVGSTPRPTTGYTWLLDTPLAAETLEGHAGASS